MSLSAVIVPPPPIISTFSRYSIGIETAVTKAGAAASSAWLTAKKIIYVPVYIGQSMTVLKVWWMNGATVGTDNVDCGVYQSAAGLPTTKLVSSGATLSAGAAVVQSVDVTDTVLPGPGLYFLALGLSGNTATIYRVNNLAAYQKMQGMCEETVTGTFALPTTATPVTQTAATIPLFGFSTVTTI